MSLSEDSNLSQSNTKISQLTFFERLSSYLSWPSYNLRWIPTSQEELASSETKIFSFLKNEFKTYAVDISEKNDEKKKKGCDKEERKIWTIEMKDPKTNKPPIVLLHGFAAAIGFWVLNLDSLSRHRHVYAIDLIGFGRSTRPNLSKKEFPEDDIVDSIELWRKKVGLGENKPFILLGHSFGGYIASSYALKYGQNLDRLILADPWGFSEMTVGKDVINRIPIWAKAIFRISLLFNPLSLLRVSGPYGIQLMKVRDDLRRKFIPLMGDDSKEILTYTYHCNANKPSGESVFKALCDSGIGAKRPIIKRANKFSPNLKLSFLYGSQSWLYREEKEELFKLFPNQKVDYKILNNAGHHLYSDNSDDFNSYINNLEENNSQI